MPPSFRLCVFSVLAAGFVGCATNQPFRLLTPGTMEQKRQRATVHDPYPDQRLGPEVVGGRPRDYQEPLPEAVKNRLYVDSVLGSGS